MAHLTFRSAAQLVLMFPFIFTDSEIATKMEMQKDDMRSNKKKNDLLDVGLSEDRNDHSDLVVIGTCGSHTKHGAFNEGFEASDLVLEKFFTDLSLLFLHALTRQGNYKKVTSSSMFPLDFRILRWVENEKVPLRSQAMLLYLGVWLSFIEEQGKSNPLNRHGRFLTVSKFVKDKLITAKLSFFIAVTFMIEPFLAEFQSDLPMAPFLFGKLEHPVRSLMNGCVDAKITEESPVTKMDVEGADLIRISKIDLSFKTSGALQQIKPKLADEKFTQFKRACRTSHLTIVKKLFEKSPLLYKMTRYITCLNPSLIAHKPVLAKKHLEVVLERVES
ncbi:hypothetical protein QAD02_007768 [Eretmocerus hayati]|uniref:Uncharacterized protein n=1 Tax=Eretmocerus hayati TaxID=131215 RepID=A0ACC2N5C8_9HYME|nr:hypothetical protein QAD02_007768 [Eretmocerus hayati]